ncbi:MAG: hypothetical protein D6771_06305, partial [Zetaproteobacteria bacterium]
MGFVRKGLAAWRALGDLKFTRYRLISRGAWITGACGDVDGDGNVEVVGASGDGRGLRVWRWENKRFAQVKGVVPTVGGYAAVALGDVFARGGMDIAAARFDGSPEVWSPRKPAPWPMQAVDGEVVAEAVVFFETASDALTPEAKRALAHWYAELSHRLGEKRKLLRFELIGKADQRPIRKSTRFPDNVALSRARAEAVARWLGAQGVEQKRITIRALGAREPEPPGLDPEALKLNRRVRVRAILPKLARLPLVARKKRREDLFHVRENKVFRTINGKPYYKVGPGDELKITLWRGGSKKDYKVVVQLDGTVSLPYIENLKVSGLTGLEIDEKITRLLRKFERHPRVDVEILKKRSKTVTIFGEVQSLVRQPTGPGTYYLIGKETLVDFLSRAGGPTKDADLTKVQLIRGG